MMIGTLLHAALQLVTQTAYAQLVGKEAAMDIVGAELTGVAGGGFGDIASFVAVSFLPFANGIAILVIVVSGMLAVIAQDENRIATARKVLVMALVAIILLNLAGRIALAYMTSFNFDGGYNPTGGSQIIELELLGIINFLETPLVVAAIISMIAYGIKALVDYNGESGQQSFRKAVLSILLGILIIVVKYFIAGSIITGDPSGIINPAVRVLFTVVAFAALIGVVVIAIAGIYLIVNLGDESRAEKAKGIIILVTIGLIFMGVIAGLLAILINAYF